MVLTCSTSALQALVVVIGDGQTKLVVAALTNEGAEVSKMVATVIFYCTVHEIG